MQGVLPPLARPCSHLPAQPPAALPCRPALPAARRRSHLGRQAKHLHLQPTPLRLKLTFQAHLWPPSPLPFFEIGPSRRHVQVGWPWPPTVQETGRVNFSQLKLSNWSSRRQLFTDPFPASASWQPSTSIRHDLRLCRASRSPTNQSGASQDGLQHCLHGAAGGAWPAGAMQGVDQRQAAQRHCRAAVPAPAGRNAAVRGDRRCLPGQSDAGLQGGQEGHHQPGGGQGPVSAARRGLRAGLRHNFMALPTLSPARLLRCAWAARRVRWPVSVRGAESGGCGGRWEGPVDGAGGSCSMRAAAPAWACASSRDLLCMGARQWRAP